MIAQQEQATAVEATVLNRQRQRKVDTPSLVRFVERLLREHPPAGGDSVVVCLVSDRRMRELNRRFRALDRSTDVLSFPTGDEPDPDGRLHLGDIVIAVPTAARQARQANHTLTRELRLLTLHGYLHLLGFDHETDAGEMLRLQRRLARRLLPTRSGG